MAAVAWGGGPAGAAAYSHAVVDPSMSHEALVSQVKDMQRHDQGVKDQWVSYTYLFGQGTRDPAKHPPEFLQAFLQQLQTGHRLPVHEDAAPLGDLVKMMQRKSASFKTAWAQFCMQYGGGTCDPAKHEPAFHVKFLDFIAVQAQGSVPFAAGLPGEVPLKRMRDGSGGGLGTSSGDLQKDQLVLRMKAMSRPYQELWARYADIYLGGIRDPARHDTATLQEFVSNHNVPSAGTAGAAGGASLPAPVIGGCVDFAALAAAGSYAAASRPGGGAASAAGGGAAGGTAGGTAGSAGGTGHAGLPPVTVEPGKDALIHRVKQYQRGGQTEKDNWTAFCGRTRDPARHELAKLQEFIDIYQVP